MKSFDEAVKLFDKSQFFYLIGTSMNGTYSYVNQHYARAFSNIHADIVGQPYDIMIPAEEARICEETAVKCFTHPDQFFPATLRKHNGTGGYITTQWEYKAMRDTSGEFIGIFCIGYDITQYVLGQEKLQTAVLDIDKKREVLKQIAYDQSHKVRMPLSNILGLCQLLQHTTMDDNTTHLFRMIYESALQMDIVIKEIVNTSYEERTHSLSNKGPL